MSGKAIRVACLFCLTSVLVPVYAGAKVVVGALEPTRPRVGTLFKATDQKVSVTVRDERPDKSFVGGAIVGPGAAKDKGIYLGYATRNDAELADFLRAAAQDAVEVLGMKPGEGYALEIVVKDFQVDMYRLSGYSPMNCIGYGLLETSLRGPDGGSLGSESLKVTFYETTMPMMSMKEVVSEAISRIFTQAAWQAAATTLLKHLQLEPDMAQIGRAVGSINPEEEDELPARQTIFWLGLARQSAPPVKDTLLALLRTSEAQRVHQAAAEAVGMLGISEAREDMVAILAGRKMGGWDNTDNEHVWYLLRGLALLGETDLRARIPKVKINMSDKLEDLVRFQETGAFPEVSEAEAKRLEKARKALVKKRS